MIRHTQDGDTWTVTIDRPDKAGALTREMLVEITEIAKAARDAKLFILTGTGSVFSAGADLDAARAGLAADHAVWEAASGAIADIAGLSIAALNGTLAGGAFGVALACDLRISAPQAKFFYPVMKLGFRPQPSDPARLARLIGPARAKCILMAGQKILAPQALDWGLVDQVVETDALMPTALALGADVLVAEHAHIAAIKGMIG